MSLDLIEMTVKINSGVALTSLDSIISTTSEFPDVLTTANGTTNSDQGPITSESFLFYFMFCLLSKYFLSTFPDTPALAAYTVALASDR